MRKQRQQKQMQRNVIFFFKEKEIFVAAEADSIMEVAGWNHE